MKRPRARIAPTVPAGILAALLGALFALPACSDDPTTSPGALETSEAGAPHGHDGAPEAVDAGSLRDGAALAPPVGPSAGTLYDPDPKTNPDDMDSFPHAIVLQQPGAHHGAILATFERQVQTATNPTRGWLLYRSMDSGKTFERLGAPVVPAHFATATNVLQPNLLELTRAAGASGPGTLLLSGVAGGGTKLEIQVFRSTDGGATWQLASVVDSGDAAVSAERPWEPFLVQLDDGSIVAYWSDEIVPGGRQNIAARVSRDGGVTWGPKVAVWQSPVDSDRPGMASVTRMGNGRYAMSVEMCGAPGDFCRAHVKTSVDGLVWGAGPADMGVRPLSPSGHAIHGNPFVAWTPRGGPAGTLILSARDLLKSVATPNDFAGGRTQTLFVNHGYAAGAWHELTAPIAWHEGANYTQAGYRNALLPLPGTDFLLYFATSYTGAGVRNRVQFATANAGILPYADPFASGGAVGWQTFGGAWKVSGGVFAVTSSGAGDKAVAGSSHWTDVAMDADVRVDGAGNAGIIVRATDPDVGADAYSGYFVGVSTVDGTAFIGRANDAWSLLGTAQPVTGGVARGAWMHLRVTATGCTFAVEVGPPGAPPSATFTASEPGCAPFGAIGVRAFQTAAAWRNVEVRALP